MILFAAILAGVVALAHTAPFPFLFEAFKPSQSVWHVKPQPNAALAIYLTFDDGAEPRMDAGVARCAPRNRRAGDLFLMDDYIIEETAPIVKRIADEGHAIGLHNGTRRLMLKQPGELATILRASRARPPPATSSSFTTAITRIREPTGVTPLRRCACWCPRYVPAVSR